MKKLLLSTLLICITLSAFSQRNDKEWFASVGLNAINSQGTQSPFGGIGDWANGIPFSAAIELGWTSGFSIEQAFTVNKFKEGDLIDGATLTEDYTYMSFDTHAKYYFGKHIFPKWEWLDLYANAGVGFFTVDETNISGNLGGGVQVWLNRRQTLGLRLQTIAKFAFDHKESGFDNNHFQTHLQLVFAL
ncbi:hypothetical protein J4050_03330 [Winogradskyella sp. DF17]|uniref:Outer membrane protein beta-barrel domain-containing protein n=1 Tax=Winogradskyella pelagia TaxID=2819984 RepID=A0ABS3SZ40_9FLAO|nr:hypothetical protein [Winogradskyella sp. DF17]MBO3115760.1 hypothetical protein [Winogradskyella sp. DF17]